jgi:hypothetical protein
MPAVVYRIFFTIKLTTLTQQAATNIKTVIIVLIDAVQKVLVIGTGHGKNDCNVSWNCIVFMCC